MSRRGNPMKQIEIRQKTEEQTASYAVITAEHNRLKMRGVWENSSTKKMMTNALLHKLDDVQARYDDLLVLRRQRLAQLLDEEKKQHEVLLEQLSESDEQRRERLMQKARELRTQREELRQKESESKKDIAFRESSSLVREAESRIKVLNVAQEREKQLEERRALAQQQKEEEEYFAAQWKEQQQKANQRAHHDLEYLHNRAETTKKQLDVQLKLNQTRKLTQRERELQEEQALVANMEAAAKKEQEAELRRKEEHLKSTAEVRERNELLRLEKEREQERLRAEEKEQLNQLLQKIAEDELAEQEKKRKAREDAAYQMKFVEAQMNVAAESETALDRLWQAENDREWSKREQRWNQDQVKREALMKDVFQSRREQVFANRDKERQEEQDRLEAHQRLIREAELLAKQDAEQAKARKQAALSTQQFLSTQVAFKQSVKQAQEEAKRNELTSAQANELHYEQKITSELEKLENAKPPQYSHVKLNGSRRRL